MVDIKGYYDPKDKENPRTGHSGKGQHQVIGTGGARSLHAVGWHPDVYHRGTFGSPKISGEAKIETGVMINYLKTLYKVNGTLGMEPTGSNDFQHGCVFKTAAACRIHRTRVFQMG